MKRCGRKNDEIEQRKTLQPGRFGEGLQMTDNVLGALIHFRKDQDVEILANLESRKGR